MIISYHSIDIFTLIRLGRHGVAGIVSGNSVDVEFVESKWFISKIGISQCTKCSNVVSCGSASTPNCLDSYERACVDGYCTCNPPKPTTTTTTTSTTTTTTPIPTTTTTTGEVDKHLSLFCRTFTHIVLFNFVLVCWRITGLRNLD